MQTFSSIVLQLAWSFILLIRRLKMQILTAIWQHFMFTSFQQLIYFIAWLVLLCRYVLVPRPFMILTHHCNHPNNEVDIFLSSLFKGELQFDILLHVTIMSLNKLSANDRRVPLHLFSCGRKLDTCHTKKTSTCILLRK
jgi:hypothetical protein